MTVDGIVVVSETDYCTKEDIDTAVKRACEDYGADAIQHITMCCCDGYIGYRVKLKDFDRIRRITGYLVGNMNTWNNAKRAEERDRVAHG